MIQPDDSTWPYCPSSENLDTSVECRALAILDPVSHKDLRFSDNMVLAPNHKGLSICLRSRDSV